MRSPNLIAALLAASFVAVPALAEPTDGRAPSARHAERAKKTPAERAAFRDQKRSAALDAAGVDANRAKQALGVMKRFDAQREPIMKQRRETMKKLREARKSKDDKAREALRAELAANRGKLATIRKSERAELGKILKPAELAKLEQSFRHGKRGKRGHGQHHEGKRAQPKAS